MNVFFDVDDTIISAWDGTLRPLVKDVFQQIRSDGHVIYIWSGVGLRWREIEDHGLRPYVEDCFIKPLRDYRLGLRALAIPVEPDFVVDDHEQVVDAFGGCRVRPYLRNDPSDREMARVYQTIAQSRP